MRRYEGPIKRAPPGCAPIQSPVEPPSSLLITAFWDHRSSVRRRSCWEFTTAVSACPLLGIDYDAWADLVLGA